MKKIKIKMLKIPFPDDIAQWIVLFHIQNSINFHKISNPTGWNSSPNHHCLQHALQIAVDTHY